MFQAALSIDSAPPSACIYLASVGSYYIYSPQICCLLPWLTSTSHGIPAHAACLLSCSHIYLRKRSSSLLCTKSPNLYCKVNCRSHRSQIWLPQCCFPINRFFLVAFSSRPSLQKIWHAAPSAFSPSEAFSSLLPPTITFSLVQQALIVSVCPHPHKSESSASTACW